MIKLPKKEILLNKRFNRLLVIEEDFSKSRTAWKCLCDCGNITIVTSDRLKSGMTQSCGCLQREKARMAHINKPHPKRKNIIGQKFGKLTVLEFIEYRDKDLFYKVKCDCGAETIVSGTHLRSGHTLSCGCLKASYGATLVEQALIQLNLTYEKEKTFPTLKNPKTNKSLRFDFYLPHLNTIIEYDGEQHFKDSPLLLEYQYRDSVKNEWCVNNKIKLIRIPYKDITKINVNYINNLLNK